MALVYDFSQPVLYLLSPGKGCGGLFFCKNHPKPKSISPVLQSVHAAKQTTNRRKVHGQEDF
jgi:hypothetical protein